MFESLRFDRQAGDPGRPQIGRLGANRLSILRQPTGARTVLVLDDDGLAEPFTATHLLDLATSGRSPNTVVNAARAIARGIAHCDAHGLDLLARCKGDFLTDLELRQVAGHMRGPGKEPRATADPDYWSFVEFLLSVGARLCPATDEGARVRAELFRATAGRLRPGDADRVAEARLGLEPAQREAFLAAIVPGSPRNPWRSGFSAYRNLVLMTTAFSLGLRSGELLSLKVGDLVLDGDPVLRVVRRPKDPDDPRPLPALVKTGGRDLPLGPDLTVHFGVLLENRAEIERANMHEYVFVNSWGHPLGGRGLRKAYQALREAHPELGSIINHMLRHDWNDRWNEMVREIGMDRDEARRLQRDAQGWSEDSDMVDVYGERSRKREGNDILLNMQERSRSRSPRGQVRP